MIQVLVAIIVLLLVIKVYADVQQQTTGNAISSDQAFLAQALNVVAILALLACFWLDSCYYQILIFGFAIGVSIVNIYLLSKLSLSNLNMGVDRTWVNALYGLNWILAALFLYSIFDRSRRVIVETTEE